MLTKDYKSTFLLLALIATGFAPLPAAFCYGPQVSTKVSVQLSAPVLPYVLEIERIANAGETVGSCGEAKTYSKEQLARLDALRAGLLKMGPKIIPDMVAVIESNAYFGSNPISSRYKRNQWPLYYSHRVCVSVLSALGISSLDYICRSGIPAQGRRNLDIEQLVYELGQPAAYKLTPLLSSRDENTRNWSGSLLVHLYSWRNATEKSVDSRPSQAILAAARNSLLNRAESKENRSLSIKLIGYTSQGDQASVSTLIGYLQRDKERDVRLACVIALLNIAMHTDERQARQCVKAVGEALQSDTDEEVRNTAAFLLSTNCTAESKSQYKDETTAALRKGMTDSSTRVRSHCVMGLRQLTGDDSIE